MILAAGLGTRLRPLTDHRPKALVEYEGHALLDHVVYKLKDAGITSIIINVHHFADMVVEHVRRKGSYGVDIRFSREEVLLDTGGGIARARWFLEDAPFLVYNVDIRCSIDLRAFVEAHQRNGAIATLAVKQRKTSRSLLMRKDHSLGGWRDNRSGETIIVEGDGRDLEPIAFSAIHMMNPEIFAHFPEKEAFPLMPFYLELAGKHRVHLHRHEEDDWMDLGRPELFQK